MKKAVLYSLLFSMAFVAVSTAYAGSCDKIAAKNLPNSEIYVRSDYSFGKCWYGDPRHHPESETSWNGTAYAVCAPSQIHTDQVDLYFTGERLDSVCLDADGNLRGHTGYLNPKQKSSLRIGGNEYAYQPHWTGGEFPEVTFDQSGRLIATSSIRRAFPGQPAPQIEIAGKKYDCGFSFDPNSSLQETITLALMNDGKIRDCEFPTTVSIPHPTFQDRTLVANSARIYPSGKIEHLILHTPSSFRVANNADTVLADKVVDVSLDENGEITAGHFSGTQFFQLGRFRTVGAYFFDVLPSGKGVTCVIRGDSCKNVEFDFSMPVKEDDSDEDDGGSK